MIAKVRLWGRTVGAVSLDDERDVAAFQYDADFARSGIELSPLAMPLSERVYEVPALPRNTRRHLTQRPALDLRADYVLANGGMSSNQPSEGDIGRPLIEADLLDCMVALPSQLFYSTQIPVCLWFAAINKAADAKRGFRDRRKTDNQLELAACRNFSMY